LRIRSLLAWSISQYPRSQRLEQCEAEQRHPHFSTVYDVVALILS
jgi:hypothetical protein